MHLLKITLLNKYDFISIYSYTLN